MTRIFKLILIFNRPTFMRVALVPLAQISPNALEVAEYQESLELSANVNFE